MANDLIERLRKVEGSTPDSLGIRTCWHRNPDGPEAADRIEALEAALREAPAALNAMASQVDAEWRDHDKAAAKHDLVVRGFREKVRHLLEGKAHD